MLLFSILLAIIYLFVMSSAHAESICNPYFTYYDECSTQICRGGHGGTGPGMDILYFNPQTNDYEIPSEYRTGEQYLLNGFMLNDNYCKKPIDVGVKYDQYKLSPQNFTNAFEYLDLKFTYLVQINRQSATEKPTAVYLDSFEGVIEAGDKKTHTFKWIPKEKGQYLIERFIWYDTKNPIVLAPTQSIQVQVHDDVKGESANSSPRQQFASGTRWFDVACTDDLVIVLKLNGLPACVSFDTATTLYKSGWAQSMENKVWYDWAKKASLQYFDSKIAKTYNILDNSTLASFVASRESLPPFITIQVQFTSVDAEEQKTNHIFWFGVSRGDNIDKILKLNNDGTTKKEIQVER